MSVKGIFKVLVGTVLLIVVSSLIIEMVNITISSLQLTQLSRIACRQAAVLFSQETYKPRDGNKTGTTAMPDVKNADDTRYISGQFYNGGSPEQIYRNLYSSKLADWIRRTPSNKNTQFKDYWHNVSLIAKSLTNDNMNLNMPTNVNDEAAMKNYTDSLIAKSYTDVMMTPLNLGIPYLDEDTITRMLQWNMAQLASDCQPSLIRKDPNSVRYPDKYYVYYNGFRVFAQDAKVKHLDYKVYEVDNGDKDEFKRVTHINPDNLGFLYSMEDLGISNDERKNICVVGIEYTMPVSYEGITPLRTLVEFIWDYDVKGYAANGEADNPGYTETGVHSWDDLTADLNAGGFNGNREADATKGVLPVPGKLIYYVVR